MSERSYMEVANVELHAAREAAGFFVDRAEECIRERGRFAVALSGGHTPAAMLDVLAEKKLDWNHIHFFWSDERAVDATHERSNYHMVKTHLFDKINLPAGNVHRVQTELGPTQAARSYSYHLLEFFELSPGDWPCFDVIYLGVGEDGHTASLFPESPTLKNEKDLVTTAISPDTEEARITFTFPLINAAKYVVVLAKGREKHQIVQTALKTSPDPCKLPIQGVQPGQGKLVWFI